jgi:cbb3-type cytochrome oxidase subunit 3
VEIAADIVSALRQPWVVWPMLLFAWFVVWVHRPRLRERLERHARIPLDDSQEDR